MDVEKVYSSLKQLLTTKVINKIAKAYTHPIESNLDRR